MLWCVGVSGADLMFAEVRNRESTLGPHNPPPQPGIHSRRLYRWRRGAASSTGFARRMGDGYRGQCPHSSTYVRVVRFQAQRKSPEPLGREMLLMVEAQSGRLPYHGVPVSTEGQEHVPSVVGPLARSLPSLHLVTKAVIDAKPWELDPKVLPLPWREEAYKEVQSRPLVIGLLVDDGVVKVHPPVERVVREVAAKLREAGHEVIDWDPSGHEECIRIMVSQTHALSPPYLPLTALSSQDQYYTADGGEDITRAVSAGGDPYLPHVSALVNRAPAIPVYEYWQLNRAKVAAQKAYLDKWRRIRSPKSGREVDVLLTPTMPHSAVPHRACRWVGYTKVWNFLDYTACVLPVGRVDRAVDEAKMDARVTGYVSRSEVDEWNWSLYDPEGMDGMPLSVQLVGQRLEEEKVLGIAQVVERLLRTPSS